MYLCESLALTLHAVFGGEGHAGPGRRTVEHDAAVVYTNFTAKSKQELCFNDLKIDYKNKYNINSCICLHLP